MSCEEAINSDYEHLAFDSDDESSCEDDAVDFDADFSRMGLGGSKHSSQSSPTPTQQQLKQIYDSFQLMGKKEERVRKAQRRRRRRQKKFEEKKKRMDAKARNAIHSTIDSKAFAPSTMDCTTAYQLWEALKPTEAYTEEDVQRSLDAVRIELCSNDMELLERMHGVVNKVAYILPKERKQYETRTVKTAMLNLKQKQHKMRFLDLIVHMGQRDTPQTVKEFEGQFLKIIKEEQEVEQYNRQNKSSTQAAYNATTKQESKGGRTRKNAITCTATRKGT